MDRYVLRLSIEEIDSLISKHKYREAAGIADTVDWSNVQSIRVLCKISDLYKINRRYEDSRDVLEMAYRRCPRGRQILYSMCELELKLGNYIRALQLYNAYINVAPTDTGRYVLKYKLYREQNVRLPEQITVLEELARHDFRERWSYELARLYHRAGRDGDCADMCDEIVAFFGDGRWVRRALELKASVAQLTDTQTKLLAQMEKAEKGRRPQIRRVQPPEPDPQHTQNWTQDSVRRAVDDAGSTEIWSTDAVRQAQEANRREYNYSKNNRTDGDRQKPKDEFEVQIDDSVLTDEQLTEPVAEGMKDLYGQEAESAEADALSTTRSWDIREVREAEQQQAKNGDNGIADTNGIDPEPEEPGDEQLMAYAQEYAQKQGFRIDTSGMDALKERIEDMHRDGYQVVPEDIRDMIDEAVYFSGHALSAHRAGINSNSKHGDRDDMVLRDKDFIHY